ASLRSLALRPPDRFFDEVNARDLTAPPGEVQGSIAGPATGVEDGAGDPVGHGKEGLLRLADVPGGLPGVHGFKSGPVGHGGHGPSSFRSFYGFRRCPSGCASRYLPYPPPPLAPSHPALRRIPGPHD